MIGDHFGHGCDESLAIVTDDGRVAAGAVPEQVFTDALTQ